MVDFIAAYIVELTDRPHRPICGVERFVPGEYVKYNNNWDWSDERRNTPQAFSHFTWEASGHTLLVCDIQGVADMYTDPQIHSIDGKGYGVGNLGTISAWPPSRVSCSRACRVQRWGLCACCGVLFRIATSLYSCVALQLRRFIAAPLYSCVALKLRRIGIGWGGL